MCEQCLAETTYIAEIVPGLHFGQATKHGHVMSPGDYAITRSNDPDFVFQVKPWPDPQDGMTDEEIDADPNTELASKWYLDFREFTTACDGLALMTSWRIVQLCREGGWDPESGMVQWWLFHRLGCILRDVEAGLIVPTSMVDELDEPQEP